MRMLQFSAAVAILCEEMRRDLKFARIFFPLLSESRAELLSSITKKKSFTKRRSAESISIKTFKYNKMCEMSQGVGLVHSVR